jgi:hypothetical protein
MRGHDLRFPAKTLVARIVGASVVVLVTAVSAKAGAVVASKSDDSPSVEQRVAAIRAKMAELTGGNTSAPLQGVAVKHSPDSPRQIAWNNWKNE